MVSKLFSFLGSILDKHLLHKKIPSFIATRFFNFFSRITNCLLFNDVAFFFFLCYLALSIHLNFYDLHHYLLGEITFGEINIYAKIFICIFLSFLDLVIVFTILAHSTVVRSYMISKYDSNIMKQLHLNNGTSTLTKAAISVDVVLAATAMAEANDYRKCQILVDAWKDVCQQCIEKGQQVPPTPKCN